MSYPALVAARAKWDRGVEDLRTLDRRIAEVRKTRRYRISVDFDRDSGWHVAHARISKQPEPDLSVLVGAAAYQFLSALNLIAWELAARKVGRNKVATPAIRNYIAFPITARPRDFRRLPLVSRAYVSKPAITRLREVQPYRGPHGQKWTRLHPLFRIKRIADADKHRVLAAVFGKWPTQGIRFVWDQSIAKGPTIEPLIPPGTKRHLFVYDGAPLSRIRFEVGNERVRVGVNRQPDADITFSDGESVFDTEVLDDCCGGVHWTIRHLTPLFPGQPNPWGPPLPMPEPTQGDADGQARS